MAMSVVYTNFCGMVVSETRSGVERDYVPDTLGSTAALVDNSESITDRWEYWPYGEVSRRIGTSPTPFTYVGMLGYFKDLLDKLFYVRARHLTPDLARWLTVDPLWPKQPAFRYARANPINLVDPSGLSPACVACGICLGVAVIGATLACAGSPMGFLECVSCWCVQNPLACALLVTTCLVTCRLCVPAIGPILGRLPVPRQPLPAFAMSSSLPRTTPCSGGALYLCFGKCIAERKVFAGCDVTYPDGGCGQTGEADIDCRCKPFCWPLP